MTTASDPARPTTTAPQARRAATPLDDFLFDLNGYLVLRDAVGSDLLARLNAAFDAFPEIPFGHWHGNAHRRDYNSHVGYELHNVVECGQPFEELIDHPSWIDLVHRYCGEAGSYVDGLFIDEAIAASARAAGTIPSTPAGSRGRSAASTSTSTAPSGAASATSSSP
ncbi:MAG TPA: hypothetical protein VK324_08525 [Tepidisphaeraceae bacterium]|nr:hypothetical protein [Tepidisphaeraceae bacterium]